MATVKVSALTETTSPNSTDELLVNQGGTSKKLQVGNLPAATPADDSITYAKIQNVSATDRILGRDTTGAGDVEEITPANLRTMINVEDGADVTDSTNVVAALTAGTNVTISAGGTIASTDTNTTYSDFTGDSGSGGAAGLVPAPSSGDAAAGKYLDSSGSFTVPPDTDTNTTYTSSDFTHDSLSGVTANEHIDWTGSSAGTIHSSNYTDTNTTYSVQDGELSENNFTDADHTKLNNIEASADVTDATNVASAGAGMLTADQSWSGSQRGTPSTVTDGTLDLDTANNFKYTPSGADTLEFSNEEAGQSGFITVINASGHAISVGSEVKKGSSWDVSTAGTYIVSYYCDGTNVYVSASEALA